MAQTETGISQRIRVKQEVYNINEYPGDEAVKLIQAPPIKAEELQEILKSEIERVIHSQSLAYAVLCKEWGDDRQPRSTIVVSQDQEGFRIQQMWSNGNNFPPFDVVDLDGQERTISWGKYLDAVDPLLDEYRIFPGEIKATQISVHHGEGFLRTVEYVPQFPGISIVTTNEFYGVLSGGTVRTYGGCNNVGRHVMVMTNYPNPFDAPII